MLTRPNTLPDQSLVSLLIDSKTSGWHDPLMRQIFIPTNVQSILSIPLSVRMPQDRLMWAFTPNGKFTIRNAYKIAMVESMETRMEGTSNGENHKSFWRRLWGLNLTNKTKSFA